MNALVTTIIIRLNNNARNAIHYALNAMGMGMTGVLHAHICNMFKISPLFATVLISLIIILRQKSVKLVTHYAMIAMVTYQ